MLIDIEKDIEKEDQEETENIEFNHIENENVEKIKTLNEHLEGNEHPVTKVPFKRDTVELSDGRYIEGVFPEFESKADLFLPEEEYKESFYNQQKWLNERMSKLVDPSSSEYDESIAEKLTDEQIEDFKEGIMPEGLTWHHHQEEGLMQLVDSKIHESTNHTGGMSIWGRGHG